MGGYRELGIAFTLCGRDHCGEHGITIRQATWHLAVGKPCRCQPLILKGRVTLAHAATLPDLSIRDADGTAVGRNSPSCLHDIIGGFFDKGHTSENSFTISPMVLKVNLNAGVSHSIPAIGRSQPR